MNDRNSKIISFTEYLKSRDKQKIQAERRAIQTEHLYQPPAPKKSSKPSLVQLWLEALDKASESWVYPQPNQYPPNLNNSRYYYELGSSDP
jgi:hypothetical protein